MFKSKTCVFDEIMADEVNQVELCVLWLPLDGSGDGVVIDASAAVGPEHVAEEKHVLEETAANTKNAHSMHQQVCTQKVVHIEYNTNL